MKPKSLTPLFILAMASLILMNCQKPTRDNPWDELAGLDPQSWAPKNIRIDVPSITLRTITWEYSGDDRIEGFKIDRKRGNENWVESYTKLGKDKLSFSDTISPDHTTIYYYKVYAYAGTVKSHTLETNTLAAFPAPSDLTLQKINDISYRLNWIDNSVGESGFIIERKTNGNEFIVIDTVASNNTTYTDPNVFAGKAPINIQYRIKAFYSQFHSEVIEVITDVELSSPSNIQFIKNSILSVTISWNDNSIGEQGFKIERKNQSQQEWENIQTTALNMTMWSDENFQLNTQISYRISAFYESYSSNYIENSFNSQIPIPEYLTATSNSPTSILLNWGYNYAGHEGFKLERKTNDGNWIIISSNIAPNVNSYEDNQINLEQNNYSYRLSVFVQNVYSSFIEIDFLPFKVINPVTGKTWMDRNLGAARVATSSTDTQAFGDLYQWGRNTDGHEKRTSGTTSTLSYSNNPGHGHFILAPSSPYNWQSFPDNNLWQGLTGTNNPCPSGYRLPTEDEWNEERQSWISNNAVGAFNSPLKLPIAGGRNLRNGLLYDVSYIGSYWSSSLDGAYARRLYFFDNNAFMFTDGRAYGDSVRCIKD